jgi:hypothetical protein
MNYKRRSIEKKMIELDHMERVIIAEALISKLEELDGIQQKLKVDYFQKDMERICYTLLNFQDVMPISGRGMIEKIYGVKYKEGDS